MERRRLEKRKGFKFMQVLIRQIYIFLTVSILLQSVSDVFSYSTYMNVLSNHKPEAFFYRIHKLLVI